MKQLFKRFTVGYLEHSINGYIKNGWRIVNFTESNSFCNVLFEKDEDGLDKDILFQELITKFESEGYVKDWGDGALNTHEVCILSKSTSVPIPTTVDKVRTQYDYVVVAKGCRVVHFRDAKYSS